MSVKALIPSLIILNESSFLNESMITILISLMLDTVSLLFKYYTENEAQDGK